MQTAISLLLACGLVGCAHSQAAREPLLPDNYYVESEPLPQHPDDIPLDANIPKEDWVQAVERGQTLDKPGLCFSESHAARDALYRIQYKELRGVCEANRKDWRSQRVLYEYIVSDQAKALDRAMPTWWDDHKFDIGVGAGFVLGSAVAVGIAAALDGAL